MQMQCPLKVDTMRVQGWNGALPEPEELNPGDCVADPVVPCFGEYLVRSASLHTLGSNGPRESPTNLCHITYLHNKSQCMWKPKETHTTFWFLYLQSHGFELSTMQFRTHSLLQSIFLLSTC